MIYYKVKPLNEDFYAIQYTGSNKDEVWLFIERFWPETYEVEERKKPWLNPRLFIVFENTKQPFFSITQGSWILRTPDNVLSLILENNMGSFYIKTEKYED